MSAENQSHVSTVSGNLLTRGIIRLEAFSPRNTVLLIVLVAIVARLIFILAAPGVGDPNSMDAHNYLILAHNLVEGRGFIMWDKPSIFVAPLYPLALAGLQLVFGGSAWAIKAFQAVLGGATVGLVYLLGCEFFSRRVANVAAGVFALHPEMIALSAFIYTEVVFIFLLLFTLLFIVKAVQTGKRSSFLIAGLLLGITNLCRGTLIYFPGFLFLFLLFCRDRLWLRRLSGVIALTIVMVLTMLPWMLRNYRHFHAIVPVAIGSGDVLWTGTYLPFDGEFRYEETQQKIDELISVKMTLIERDRALMAEAKKNILAEPLRSAWLFVRKMGRYWFRVYENVPQGQSRQTNWLILGGLGITHFVVLALAAVGIWHTNVKAPIIGVMLLLFFYYTLIHAATLAVPRYRLPLVPEMCMFAAGGLWAIRSNWRLIRQ